MVYLNGFQAVLPFLRMGDPMVVLHVASVSGPVVPAAFLADTGSPVSVVTLKTAGAIGIDYKAARWRQRALDALSPKSATKIPLAEVPLHVGFTDERGVRVFVTLTEGGVADLRYNILGRDFLNHFRCTFDDRLLISPKEGHST